MEMKATFGFLQAKTVIDVAAGMVGLLFDRFDGEAIELEEEVVPADDLTMISGIGPAFARRLNEAGITTYAQLAELTADEVRQRAELSAWQGDPEEWIAQAKSLA